MAWVLPGGGARGAVQVGAARALVESGREPELITAGGVGVINACLYATGGPDHMETAWRTFTRRAWRARPSLRDNPLIGQSLASPARLRADIEAHIDFGAVLASEVTLAFTLLNLSEGRLEVHGNRTVRTEDELRRCCRAGFTLPVLHPPVRIRDDAYVGAAMAWDAPLAHAVQWGATDIFCLRALPSRLSPAGPLRAFRPIVRRSYEALWHVLGTGDAQAFAAADHQRAGPAITVLEPKEAATGYGLRRVLRVHPRRTRELIDEGYDDACSRLRQARGRRAGSPKIVPLHARPGRRG